MPAALPHNTDSFSLIKRLVADYLLPYKGKVLFAILFMALSGGMTALIAALMEPVLDDVLFEAKQHMILPVCLGVAFAFIVRGLATYIHVLLMNKVGNSIIADIQNQLFSHFVTLDMAFFQNHPSGELLSRVTHDVTVLRATIVGCLTGFGKSFFTLIFLIGVMLYQDWKLTLIAFIVFPLLSGFVVYIGWRLRKLSKQTQSEVGILSDILSQSFRGIRLVKAYGAETHEIQKVSDAVEKVKRLNIKAIRVSALSTPVNESLVGFIFAAIIAYGGYQVIGGHSTAGELASFVAAFSLAYEPMKKLAKLNNTLQSGLGACERVFAMLDRSAEIYDKADAEVLEVERALLSFDAVDFSYVGADFCALSAISFEAKPDTVTALVGLSGGGKSTILNLIPRFYDIGSGAVRINEHDIRDVTQDSLRRHIALVSQDIMIFNESALDNIRYGRMDASEEDVREAARQAAADGFISELEHGYDTVLGEEGVKLSGGQKQRIAIARAILRDAPILLLDEATSALDNESEQLVQNALKTLQKGRTTLVIAHRLTTVQDADQILVLSRGAIVERGSHNSLMALGGVYAKMYHAGMKSE